MKKIKIMLLSLALMAIVGGAVVSKVKGELQLCYTTQYVVNSQTTCTLKDFFTDQGEGRVAIYTTTPVGMEASCSYYDGQANQPITCCCSTTVKEG